ncbi:MAG: hypothetical protein E7290_10715 [Lachnospiraceae bacterium]|nr:hypothetical protein [Lachnospiraceae bacterium]
MEKWRLVLGGGIILGVVLNVMDYFITEIPYVIFIPLQIVAIVLLFGGFIWRKREMAQKKG